jgi:hypothetical protein
MEINMDTTIITAIVQGIVQVVTIIGTIWGLFNKQQKDLDAKISKRMDRLETKFNLSQRPAIVPVAKHNEEPKV